MSGVEGDASPAYYATNILKHNSTLYVDGQVDDSFKDAHIESLACVHRVCGGFGGDAKRNKTIFSVQ